MTTNIFISGSMRIKRLDPKVKEKIDDMIISNSLILLGDADGVDASIQEFLNSKGYRNVTIFCSGKMVRNNIDRWNVVKINTNHKENTRLFYTAKDIEMAKKCDQGYMVWDSKSTGTLNNVYELLCQEKKSTVFVNKNKTFYEVLRASDFDNLVDLMSENAFNKADKKIHLKKKIQGLKQTSLF
jgi:hypothetical protein